MTPPRHEQLPPVAAFLGYAGALPFLGTALASWLDPAHAPLWEFALLAYGAVIVSFVGALYWGVAMTASRTCDNHARRWSALYAWSVVPSLLAWAALLSYVVLVHSKALPWALLLLAFVAHYIFDRRQARAMNLPSWYRQLRLRLTTVACLCLLSQSVLWQTAGAAGAAFPSPSVTPVDAPMRSRDMLRVHFNTWRGDP